MLRSILRNVQFTLLLSASLLVLLAFQRLRTFDLPVLVGSLNGDDGAAGGGPLIGITAGGGGGGGGVSTRSAQTTSGRHGSKIFSTNVIEIGLFRFVVPFRWVSADPDGEDRSAAGDGGDAGGGPVALSATRTGQQQVAAAGRRKSARASVARRQDDSMVGKADRQDKERIRGIGRDGGVARGTKGSDEDDEKGSITSALEHHHKPRVNSSANVPPKRKSVAYVVTVLSCPADELELMQGLAVLRQSIVGASAGAPDYFREMYVAVHPDAEGCGAKPTARALGYGVVAIPQGGDAASVEGTATLAVVSDSEIRRAKTMHARADEGEEAPSARSWIQRAFADHDVVVSLPMDSVVIRPLDGLIHAVLGSTDSMSWHNISLILSEGNVTSQLPIRIDGFIETSSGFAVLRTDSSSFQDLIAKVILGGGCYESQLWNGTSDCTTGGTPLKCDRWQQQRSAPGDRRTSVLFLDPCFFGRCERVDSSELVDSRRCEDVTLADLWVISMSSCSRPWDCDVGSGGGTPGEYCQMLYRVWFFHRMGLDHASTALAWPVMEDGNGGSGGGVMIHRGYCRHEGVDGYVKYEPRLGSSVRAARLLRAIGLI